MTIAKRVDTRIHWDAENLKITNLPDANQYVRTEYRKGWKLCLPIALTTSWQLHRGR